ncbi:MAG: amidohydrolase family protein [Nitriliruptorales bacterium]|nr:amidohydrolase family protein [Nitriliruptorales bacterium]
MSLVIDADAHANENTAAWTDLAAKRPDWLTFGTDGDAMVAMIEGRPYPKQSGRGRGVPIESSILPAALHGAFDVHQRLRDMDTDEIDVQVMYGGLSIGITGYEDAGLAADVAEAYNGWLLTDLCAADPSRLKGVATVPLQDTARAIAELQRATAAGAVAVTIPPVVGDRNLDDPSLLDFFAAAEEADVALGVHSAPGMHLPLPAAGRFDNYVQVHLLSFPVDQMVAFTALVFGGVLDRFPRLRVAFLEAGIGWVPWFIERAHEHHEKRADLVPDMQEDPAAYIERGQCFFSFECEDSFLELYVDRLGADSVVFASDYPHWDAEFPGTVAEAREIAAPLGEEVTAKVLGTNALRLYGLDPADLGRVGSSGVTAATA